MTLWLILIICIAVVLIASLLFAVFGALVINSKISREEEERQNGKSKL